MTSEPMAVIIADMARPAGEVYFRLLIFFFALYILCLSKGLSLSTAYTRRSGAMTKSNSNDGALMMVDQALLRFHLGLTWPLGEDVYKSQFFTRGDAVPFSDDS